MCGFVVLLRAEAGTHELQSDPCEDIVHRGPDALGHRSVSRVRWTVDAHFRRLAILDLETRSNQPFGAPDRGLLVYNGEIYNYDELRSRLVGRGLKFQTTGDTEVLYELLLQDDWRALLQEVDGMFAFVLVLPSGEVCFGRDRLGIKPLYQTVDGQGRVTGLASEIGPLRSSGLCGDIDEVAVASAAMFLWVPPPSSGWKGCTSVPAGTVWRTAPPEFLGGEQVWFAAPPASAGHDLAESVRTSVSRQVKADVPVALLLSGGLDSSWLAIELTRQGLEPPFLAARFGQSVDSTAEPFEEDAPYAQRVAESLGRQVHWCDLDSDVLGKIPDMVDAMEQPMGDPAAIALMLLSKAAATQAKVLLSGVGVEEIFLGYERYQAIKVLSRIPKGSRRLVGRVASSRLPRRYRERAVKFHRLLSADPADWCWVSQSYFGPRDWQLLSPTIGLEAVVARHRGLAHQALAEGNSLLETAAAVDRQLFLPGLNLMYADRASMHASVELRVPFLGEPVLSAAAAASSNDSVGICNGKRLFRRAAQEAGVPEFVTRRSKTGFGAPVRSIMRTHGKEVWGAIANSELFTDLFDKTFAETLFRDHVSGAQELGLPLFGLTALAVWWDRNVTHNSRVSDALIGISAASRQHTGVVRKGQG